MAYRGNSLISKYNNYLKNKKCTYKFNKIPRLGCNALFDMLLKNQCENIYISHFSLTNENNQIDHLYNINRKPWDGHIVHDEINILKWLHNNNIIDATLCNLKDHVLPMFDCNIVKPSVYVTHLLLKEYGICILENFFDDEAIKNFISEFDVVFENNKKHIEILDKEECSKDERMFFAEKYSDFIKNNFYNNSFLNEIALKYNKNLKKKLY